MSFLIHILTDTLKHCSQPWLLFLGEISDEHISDFSQHIKSDSLGAGHILTTRFNQYQQLKQNVSNNITVEFNDINLSDDAINRYQHCVFVVSKEKPQTLHMLNQAYHALKHDGECVFIGKKQHGIPSYLKHAQTLFCEKPRKQKLEKEWLKASVNKINDDSTLLDTKNYTQLQAIKPDNSAITYYSKPGVFGWNKIDNGSALLIESLPNLLNEHQRPIRSLVDLGCGYGYLSLQSANYFQRINQPIPHITATDNNAAALISCEKTFSRNAIQGDVVASNVGDSLSSTVFDMIVCNPPFHQGFANTPINQQFLKAAQRLLKKSGLAVFVVNHFIQLEQLANDYFNDVSVINSNAQFKILCFKQPK